MHRRKPATFGPETPLVWATCLRSLAFVSPLATPGPGDEFYVGHRAYEFLLEIVCGLHSPILGETEVMGQFKIFASTWVEVEPRRTALVQRVLADAKALRAGYLVNLGTQSYGSWLRRAIESPRVHVVGAGHLAREIVPHLTKRGEVVVHARRAVDFSTEVRTFAGRSFDSGALVIAAPVSAAEVSDWLGERRPVEIFDLRDDSTTDHVTGAITLAQIFDEIESTRAKLIPRLEAIRRDIAARAERLGRVEKLRPQGWDDLCA